MAKRVRTFIAVEVPLEVMSRAIQVSERLQIAQAKVSWVKADNLHLTLKFLGDVPDNELNDVCAAVKAAAATLSAFEAMIRGVGAFPNVRRPRTIWLGVEKGRDQLIELFEAIEDHLHPLGFRRDGRRFRPHLTIGRVRSITAANEELAELIQKRAETEFGMIIVDEITVFSSLLTPQGAVHHPLGHGPLAG